MQLLTFILYEISHYLYLRPVMHEILTIQKYLFFFSSYDSKRYQIILQIN